jgi:hypothetical protein
MQFENSFGDTRLTGRKSSVRRLFDSDTWLHRTAAMASSAMTYVVTGFAYCGAAMYPELFWPLLAQLDGRASTKEPPPDSAPERIFTQKVLKFPPRATVSQVQNR